MNALHHFVLRNGSLECDCSDLDDSEYLIEWKQLKAATLERVVAITTVCMCDCGDASVRKQPRSLGHGTRPSSTRSVQTQARKRRKMRKLAVGVKKKISTRV
jgi:hypothetical protein